MTKYYKGKIRNSSFSGKTFSIHLLKCQRDDHDIYFLSDRTSYELYSYFKNYSSKELEQLNKDLHELTTVKANDDKKREYDKLLGKASKIKPTNSDFYGNTHKIYYEKRYDKDGNEYTYEVTCGARLPIIHNYTGYTIKYTDKTYECPSDAVFFDKENGNEYYIRGGYLIDRKENYVSSSMDIAVLKGKSLGSLVFINIEGVPKNIYVVEAMRYDLEITPKLFYEGKRIDRLVVDEEIATPAEVEALEMSLDGPKNERKRLDYKEEMRNFAKSNYLGEGLEVFECCSTIRKEEEDKVTKAMQDLEFKLSKLKGISSIDYIGIYNEYQDLLDQKIIDERIYDSIVELQNKADLALLCGGTNTNQIIDYMEKYTKQFLENIKSGKKSDLSIKDLDVITNRFLITKDKYSYKELNSLLRCVSLLYFFVLYNNQDSLTIDMLEKSYVKDNIKRIVIAIIVLQEEGIIKNVPRDIYDVNDVGNLLYFIKNIRFNNKFEEKELIKKIQL